jgi:VWFA-related protein
MRLPAVSALVVAAVGAASFPVVSGLSRTQDQPPRPTFRTEANYVRVDVYPTANGAPVADLAQADFEVLENGVPQKIEQFERVLIRANVPQDARVEPNTVRDSRAMLENSRARVFVVFLDTYHVEVEGSHRIRQPLVDALDRLIGSDDLVGVMTPEMSARDITFARKTTTIEGFLARHWYWGERSRLNPPDPEDEQYGACYPNVLPGDRCADQNGIAAEMIDRRHEKRTIDALEDLVRFLRGVREERKAILAITDGWLLYRPNQGLMRPLACQGVPSGPGISVDPRSGKLTTKEPSNMSTPVGKCNVDRMNLAQIDNDREFRDLLDEANAANASFYPIDPRGLAVFDTPLVRQDVPGLPAPVVAPSADRSMLTSRLTSLRMLAESTDGLAIVNSNDLAGGLRRVVADLSSYYLLGYYSTGKLDGKFHPITVRVKRAGVQVRARRGYLAATPATAASATRSAAAAPAKITAEARAMDSAIAPLDGFARELPVRLQAVAGWTPGHAAQVWTVGEFSASDEWKSGVEADVMLTSAAGATLATAHATVPIGARTFRVALMPADPLSPGDYVIRLRARGSASSMASNETLHIALPESPEAQGAVFIRRGPASGNKEVPTADLRFRRNEQIRVEIPTVATSAMTARLLDRRGGPLAVPVTSAVRDDGDGSRWQTAQLALAPLAAGDYVIELSGKPDGAGGSSGEARILVGFRVVQ